jgi:hypothetical protein
LINTSQPSFDWTATETFTKFKILFSMSPTDFKTFGVLITKANISGTKNNWTPSIQIWKKIMTSSYNKGTVQGVHWKITGTRSDNTITESEVRRFHIGAPRAVTIHSPFDGAALSSMTPFDFNANCNVKFRLEFSTLGNFSDSRKIKGFNFRTGMSRLNSFQWVIVKNLLGTTGTGYFRIKAWDALNRQTTSEPRSFTLG